MIFNFVFSVSILTTILYFFRAFFYRDFSSTFANKKRPSQTRFDALEIQTVIFRPCLSYFATNAYRLPLWDAWFQFSLYRYSSAQIFTARKVGIQEQ